MRRMGVAALLLAGCACGSPERAAREIASRLPIASEPQPSVVVPLPPPMARDEDVPAGAIGPAPSVTSPWSPDDDLAHPEHVIVGGHRVEIDAAGAVRIAETSFDTEIVHATRLEHSWIFVAEDGAAAISDDFLGSLRALPDAPAPPRFGSRERTTTPPPAGCAGLPRARHPRSDRGRAAYVTANRVYVATDARGFSLLDAVTERATDAVFDTALHGVIALESGARATDDGGLTLREARDDECEQLFHVSDDAARHAVATEWAHAFRRRILVALAHARLEVRLALGHGVELADGSVPLVIDDTILTLAPDGSITHELALPTEPHTLRGWGSALAVLTPPEGSPQTLRVTRDGASFTTIDGLRDVVLAPVGTSGLVRRALPSGIGGVEMTTDAGATFHPIADARCTPHDVQFDRALVLCPTDPFHHTPRVIELDGAVHDITSVYTEGDPALRFDALGHVCTYHGCVDDAGQTVDGTAWDRMPLLSRRGRGVLLTRHAEEADPLPDALWIDGREIPFESPREIVGPATDLTSVCSPSACLLTREGVVSWDAPQQGIVHHHAAPPSADPETDGLSCRTPDDDDDDGAGDVVAATPAGPIVLRDHALRWVRSDGDVTIATVDGPRPTIFVHARRDRAIAVVIVEPGAVRGRARALRVDASGATRIAEGDVPFTSSLVAAITGDDVTLLTQTEDGSVALTLDELDARRLPTLARDDVSALPACTGEPSPLALLATVVTGCGGLAEVERAIARVELASGGYCVREIQAHGFGGAVTLEPTTNGFDGIVRRARGENEVTCEPAPLWLCDQTDS